MHLFDRFAQRYDRWYERPFGASAYHAELTCLIAMLGRFNLGLEVGVGTGRFAGELGVQVGVDPAFEMLKLAQKRGVLCVQGAGEHLPFRAGSFELVLIVVSLCFVKDPLQVLREARRVLKEDGRLLLGLILAESQWAAFYRKKAENGHPIYSHARFYSLPDVERMLKAAGFKPVLIRTTLLDEPQDERPVAGREIVDGFDPTGGFTCILAMPGV